LVTAVRIYRHLPEVDLGAPRPLREQVRQAAVIVRRPVVAGAIAAGFVIFVLIFGLFLTVLPVHLDEEFGLSAGYRGLILAAPALTSTIAAFNLPRLQARWGRRLLLVVPSATFAVAFVVMGLAPVVWLLVLAALMYGFGEGASIPTLQELVAGSAPVDSRGTVMAAFVGVVRGGQAVGPLVAGSLIAAIGTGATFVAGGGLALALLLAQLIGGRRLVRPEPG
jgi:MFS family permease